MLVKGRHSVTEVKELLVEVNAKAFLRDIYWKATSKPNKAVYIRDKYWYVEDGFDCHRGEDLEKQDREATAEELELYNAFITLVRAIQDE